MGQYFLVVRRLTLVLQDMDMVCMERLPDQLPGCPESGLQGFLADALNFSPGPLLPGGTFGGSLGVSPLRRLQVSAPFHLAHCHPVTGPPYARFHHLFVQLFGDGVSSNRRDLKGSRMNC